NNVAPHLLNGGPDRVPVLDQQPNKGEIEEEVLNHLGDAPDELNNAVPYLSSFTLDTIPDIGKPPGNGLKEVKYCIPRCSKPTNERRPSFLTYLGLRKEPDQGSNQSNHCDYNPSNGVG